MTTLLPSSTIGMLGGGQLGRMSTLIAKQIGYRVVTLDPTPNSPCGQVADEQIIATYTDPSALRSLAEKCDVITYEFENVAAESVEVLLARGIPVYPSGQVLHITQSRLREKTFVRQAGLNVVDFQAIRIRTDLDTAAANIGFPAILKTISGGYDGKGQFVLSNKDEALAAFESILPGSTLIWEKKAAFVKELSVICARNARGDVATYPATENIHLDNILDMSIAPARIPASVQQAAQEIARTLAIALDLVGVCGIELFLLPDNSLLINEIAPRPHNSGHHTIDACACSQFEQHIRAITALPLGDTALIKPAVMVNILGSGTGNRLTGVADILKDKRIHFHLYGKSEAKAKRKMGHLTVLANEVETAIKLASSAREKLTWVG